MTVRSGLALAAGAILVVGGGAIAVILSTGGDLGLGPEAPPPEVSVPSAPAPVQLGPLPGIGTEGKLVPVEAAPPVEYGPGPVLPDPESWEAVPTAARVNRLGPIGPVMANELNELQPRLALCFDEETQARHGHLLVTRPLDGRTAEESSVTLLVLLLELQPGQIRIVDAPVESQGKASDGLLACAQRILRGHVIPTPVVRGPGRARLVFPLNP